MDREQNVMPEQADILYTSSSDDNSGEEQEGEEEPDDSFAIPLWLLVILLLIFGAFQSALAGAIFQVIWHWPLWVSCVLSAMVYVAWVALMWRRLRSDLQA